jgi:hypothetical protein
MVFRSRSAGALRALLILSVVFSGAQACGGRSDMEEYSYGAGEPVTTAGRSGAGGGTSLGGSAGTGSSLGGRGGASPIGPTAGTTSIGGTFAVGGASGSGGTGLAGTAQGGAATAGSTAMGGVAGAPDGPTITCGEASCDADTQTCCASGGLRCVPRGAACDGAVLGCTTNTDCGEDLCCLSLTGDASAASSCKPQCSMGGTRDRQLCQVDQDCREPFRFCTPTVFGVNICTRRP